MKRRELTPEEKLDIRLDAMSNSIRDVQGRMRVLEESWREFVPAVTRRISNEIILPGLIRGLAESIQLPRSLESELPDPLSLDFIDDERRSERKKGADG